MLVDMFFVFFSSLRLAVGGIGRSSKNRSC